MPTSNPERDGNDQPDWRTAVLSATTMPSACAERNNNQPDWTTGVLSPTTTLSASEWHQQWNEPDRWTVRTTSTVLSGRQYYHQLRGIDRGKPEWAVPPTATWRIPTDWRFPAIWWTLNIKGPLSGTGSFQP